MGAAISNGASLTVGDPVHVMLLDLVLMDARWQAAVHSDGCADCQSGAPCSAEARFDEYDHALQELEAAVGGTAASHAPLDNDLLLILRTALREAGHARAGGRHPLDGALSNAYAALAGWLAQ